MNLHYNKTELNSAIKASSEILGIPEVFIEKDYWITLVLKRLSESIHIDNVVFKGGTSLSKGYKLIDRFSEDIDIAVIDVPDKTGNQVKILIRDVEKAISTDLSEIEDSPLTSKGSRFRKAVFVFPSSGNARLSGSISDKLIIEINSFANPYPYENCSISSLIYDALINKGQKELIEKYQLFPFSVNILDKRQTMLEKLVSLFRFSFEKDTVTGLTGKIRHFYDLYFLFLDNYCKTFINSGDFRVSFDKLWAHDQIAFKEPEGWNGKSCMQSPLIIDFTGLWAKLKSSYIKELSALAYNKIPEEKNIADVFVSIIKAF